MFFGYILRENRSALELLSADYTFVNERLAKHYGIPGVYGERFRQVKLTDPNRLGLLGPGQHPVADRGRDPHVAGLPRQVHADAPSSTRRRRRRRRTCRRSRRATRGRGPAPKTVREQLELHRSNAAVRGLPRIIDPPGFALENFNSVGQWRDADDRWRADRRRRRARRRHEGRRSGGAAQRHPEPARRVRDRRSPSGC